MTLPKTEFGYNRVILTKHFFLPSTANINRQSIVTTMALAIGRKMTCPKLPKLETNQAMSGCFDFREKNVYQ